MKPNEPRTESGDPILKKIETAARRFDAGRPGGRIPVWVGAALLGAGLTLAPGCAGGGTKTLEGGPPPAGLNQDASTPPVEAAPEPPSPSPMEPVAPPTEAYGAPPMEAAPEPPMPVEEVPPATGAYGAPPMKVAPPPMKPDKGNMTPPPMKPEPMNVPAYGGPPVVGPVGP
jgi:hypothetical protein